MLVSAELYVRDLPGQLVGSLEPISMVDGNIVGVVHDREQKVNQRILVSVTFEISTSKDLDRLKAIWKSKDIIISQIGSVYKTVTMDYMILGTFNAGYVDTLLENASRTVDFESVDVTYSSHNDSGEKRTALITAELKSSDDQEILDSFLSDACDRDNLIYIRGI